MTPNFASSASSSASTWRHPPADVQEKYNVSVLPAGFQPTPEEEELLDMYDTIRKFEKEADRLKQEEARKRLADAATRFEEANKASSANKKTKKKKIKMKSDDHENEDEVMDDMEEDSVNESIDDSTSVKEEPDEETDRFKEVMEERKQQEKQEKLRAELLGSKNKYDDDDVDMGPSIKKQKRNEDEDNKQSLIANIATEVTPPHDFSKSLELKSWEGTVLFPSQDDEVSWSPPASASDPNDGALEFTLGGFNMEEAQKSGKNTICIKYMAPNNSKRFSINIAAGDHRQYDSVLFHFNPRQFEKGGQLVLNNKQEGMWGQAVNVPLSRIPKIFGETSCTVMIQIHEEGFDVFIEDKHCARLEHRTDINVGDDLFLQFPVTDDRRKVEKWTIYKVWWGHKKIMAKEDNLTDVYGVNAYTGLHPKKLFIKGLKPIKKESDIDFRRANFERFFRKYGGDRGVVVTIPTNSTYIFIECASEQLANLALEEMADQYDIKRARRKKHEALKEARAVAKESTEWD